MALKNKKKKEPEDLEEIEYIEENDGKNKKKGKGIFVFLIIAIIIGSLIAIIGFNVGNIRNKYLKNVPIIKNLIPSDELETNIENDKISPEQATIEKLNQEIESLNLEIDRLKIFETNQLEFKQQKEEFDRLIALNDPSAYAQFYQSIYPENAEKLYKEAIIKDESDKNFKDYTKTFENMKKDAAAKILEELVLTDMDLVVRIMKNISSDKRGEILSAMDTKNAASISKLLAN